MHPPQPGVDVAAQVDDVEAEPEGEQLSGPPRRAGAHGRPCGQLTEGQPVAGDHHVARVLTDGDGGEGDAVGGIGRQVLERVHGHVHVAGQQRLAYGGHEHPGAADGGERGVVDVAAGGHVDQLDGSAGHGGQPVGDDAALGVGKRAGPGAEAQGVALDAGWGHGAHGVTPGGSSGRSGCSTSGRVTASAVPEGSENSSASTSA